ncbi:MAG: General secretion pathway protein E [Parcubacteria group bacterium GW2011_GWA2_52_8]|nr:MAG: General secretion pathway protein E [Parcubacteria group bacterium GW2011_GWA2_52_8]
MATKSDFSQGSASAVVDDILKNAVMKRASDIHLDPEEDNLIVRFRIDGVLYPYTKVPIHTQDEVTSRIKVAGKMNIAERRFPQDGRLEFTYDGKVYNVRISTTPTIHGEAVALRILTRDTFVVGLNDLGLDTEQLQTLTQLATSPYGMVLITGPTGSGKTTLLYSILGSFDRQSHNIVTLEDPIELEIGGIRQIQIDEAIGFDFVKALRSVLRQDPNVIMVGEIRDPDTAQMAFQAALTGLLVFSTFHTFDVAGLVVRFIEMGVPRSIVAHSLGGVISSRLVRKICPSCAAPYRMSDLEKKTLGLTGKELDFKKGTGCEHCQKSGYLGRTGLFEIVQFDDDMRTRIIEERSIEVLREFFQKKIPKSLRRVAADKVLQGITTAEEVVRVLGADIQQKN